MTTLVNKPYNQQFMRPAIFRSGCPGPILLGQRLLDGDLALGKIFREEPPCRIEHLGHFNLDVDGQQLFGLPLGELQRPFVVIGEVEAVLQLGLGVGRIGIEPHRGIHHLRMVLAGLLPYHKLFQT